jgi:hypothetical protein
MTTQNSKTQELKNYPLEKDVFNNRRNNQSIL